MSLYVILITQRSSPICLSLQQVVSKPVVVWGKRGKVNEIPFAVGAGTKCVYLNPFANGVGRVLSQLEWERYIETTMRCEIPMKDKRCAGLTCGDPWMMHK